MSDLKNPMRFSIRNTKIDLSRFDVKFTEMKVRPGEGSIELYWNDKDADGGPDDGV